MTAPHRPLALLALALLLVLAACSGEPEAGSATPATVSARPAPTEFALPTLYPTPTRPSQQLTATPTLAPTAPPESTADLQQQLVELRYTIPALGLDRRLEGNVAGTVTVVDETAGVAATLQNQGGVLFELQTALPDLELAPLTDGCAGCVQFAYSLPLSGEEGDGWLQDAVMLASVENYFALTLGPHWPAGAVVGLRRSASPYQVAHTIAYTAGGQLYRWRATEPEVAGPEEVEPPLPAADVELAGEYRVPCPGSPLETLYLQPGADGESVTTTISCPAFSLPPALLPLYAALDEQIAPLFAGDDLAPPPSDIPLETMVVYELPGDGRVLLLLDDTALFEVPGSEDEPDTLALEPGTVLSVTATLAESGALTPGVAAYTAAEADYILLVRTESGMAEAAWDEEPPEALLPGVAALDAIWEQLAGTPLAPTGTPEATGTPGTATPEASATPRE